MTDLLANLLAPYTGGADPSLNSQSPLLSLALSVAMQPRQTQQGFGGGSSGGGGGGVTGSVDSGAFDFGNWAENYGQSGVPQDLLIALKTGNYPMTGDALRARPDLAAAYRTAARAYHQDTGNFLGESLVSGWRPFQSSSPLATDMRNSDHWLAGAIDLAANSAADQWFRQHGGQFGFASPGAGYHWNDPGHFSFTAGGFEGSHSAAGDSWGDPTGADARWIALARQLFG